MDLRLSGFCAIVVYVFRDIFQASPNIFQENTHTFRASMLGPICRVLFLSMGEVRYMEYRRHILFFPTITCGFPPIPKYKVD